MNIVDSSGWLEYFADGPNASFFSRPLAKTSDLVVPSITIYEVFKVVLGQRGESDALQTVALMQQGSVVDLSAEIAILAAKVSIEYRLPMALSLRPHGCMEQPCGLRIRTLRRSMGSNMPQRETK